MIGTGKLVVKLLAVVLLGFIFLNLSMSQCITPAIVIQPQSQTVMEGMSVTFAVEATGTEHLIYQWQKNGVDIVGANLNTLIARHVRFPFDNGAKYRVIVANECGSVTSDEAILTVKAIKGIPTAVVTLERTVIGNQKAIAIGPNKAANNIEITSNKGL